MTARSEIDFGVIFAPSIVYHLETGEPVTVVAGVHTGCYELFANKRIHRVTDLKGKSVGTPALARGRMCTCPPSWLMSVSTRSRTSTGWPACPSRQWS